MVVSTAETATSTAAAAASHHLRFKIFICCPSPPARPEYQGGELSPHCLAYPWYVYVAGLGLTARQRAEGLRKNYAVLRAAAGNYAPVRPPCRVSRPAAP